MYSIQLTLDTQFVLLQAIKLKVLQLFPVITVGPLSVHSPKIWSNVHLQRCTIKQPHEPLDVTSSQFESFKRVT